MDMSLATDTTLSDGELARKVVKASDSLYDLSPEELIRFHFWMVVTLRRFEAFNVQRIYGSAEWWTSLRLPLATNL